MKALVAGWFSFENMGATAGDLLARDLTCEWLKSAGYQYDVSVAAPFTGGIDWRSADPGSYSIVVFVCGPFGNGWPLTAFLAHFSGCRLIGLNLSMLQAVESWNPFGLLLERDSSRAVRPDISFLSTQKKCPVVGVILVHPQAEYARGRHALANAAIGRLMASREAASVNIDTRLDENSTGLRSSVEVESLIARMDVVVTTRLHGLALAIKNGVPALAIDPIEGGAKIRRQAEAIDWPAVLAVESVTDETIADAFDYCLTDEARSKARECRERAVKGVVRTRDEFIASLRPATSSA
jgi:Polysaccharide pyruvyl transferase